MIAYLTAEESAFTDGKCAVEIEDTLPIESDRELVTRLRLVASDAHPEVQSVIDCIGRGDDIEGVIDSIPAASLPVVYFAVGVRGMTALIEVQLQSIQSDENLTALCALSKVRHMLIAAHSFAHSCG